MYIAIVVEGTRGDVYPMLSLGRSLMAAGHTVRLCAPPDFGAIVAEQGMDFRPLGVNIREFITAAAHALHSRGPRFFAEMNAFGEESIDNQFRILPEATAGADCIVAAGTILGAASAAELHGIPFRYVMYTPAMLPSAEYSPAAFPFQVRSRRINRLLWWGAQRMLSLAVRKRINGLRRDIGLAPVTDIWRHALTERPIMAVDAPLAPVPDDCVFEYDSTRCLHPLEGDPLPAKLESFLDSGPPPIYLGFGSMPDPDPHATTARLLDAISQLGCRAILSRGWAGIGDGPLPEGVMAIDGVSHASLFPRLAVVVHHGGSGTTHTAARAGVPQIIVPHVLDQFYFARRIEDLGVGPPAIARGKLSVSRLADVIRVTLDNELLAERAGELASRLEALGPAEIDPALIVGAG